MFAVVAVVAAVGIVAVTYSLASSAAFTWSSKVTSSARTATYKVSPSAAGTLSATLKWTDSASLSINVANSAGKVLATQTGNSPLSLSAPVTKGTYHYTVTWVKGTKQVPFTLTGTVPVPDPTPTPTVTPTPTPTATPVPTPTPITGSSSCPLPAYPNPSCTGVPAGTSFASTVNGDYNASVAGQVIDGWHITGALVIKAAGVVVKNSQIDSYIDNEVASASSFSINDSTVGPATCATDGWPSINGHDFTASRVYLRGRQDGVDMVGSNVSVADSFFQPCFQPASVVGSDGFHTDGVQDQCSATCSNITLSHVTIDARGFYQGQSMGNSALNLGSKADGLHMQGVTLRNNLFMGGSYTTDLQWDAGAKWVVTGNSWVDTAWAYAAISTEGTCSNQSWSTDSVSNIPNRIVAIDANYLVTSTTKTTACVD